MSEAVDACRICGNRVGNRAFTAREMMFGLREAFDYFECSACGCLQIVRFPEDLAKHYPRQYYSFRKPSRLKVLIKGAWLSDPFPWSVAFKRALSFLPFIHLMPEWMVRARLGKDRSVLEVGSGNGARLTAMRQAGFRDLTGVDPFIADERLEIHGVTILKKEISEILRQFDFIMLHHAFEHLPDQQGTLKELFRVLRPDGVLLLRIPIASFAWKKYGIHWVQLDAPRHFYLHTVESLKLLVEKAGFEIFDSFFDSNEFQFWGSEQYVQDIPLRAPRSYDENPSKSIFSRSQIRAWSKQAEQLNRRGEGDSAAFYLRKSR